LPDVGGDLAKVVEQKFRHVWPLDLHLGDFTQPVPEAVDLVLGRGHARRTPAICQQVDDPSGARALAELEKEGFVQGTNLIPISIATGKLLADPLDLSAQLDKGLLLVHVGPQFEDEVQACCGKG